jgi:hypothetical protein
MLMRKTSAVENVGADSQTTSDKKSLLTAISGKERRC